MSCNVVCVWLSKGGVGKTVTTVDLDPQGDLGKALDQDPKMIRRTISNIFNYRMDGMEYDAGGNQILLHPFVKKHNRNTMKALETSIRLLEDIEAGDAVLVAYRFRWEVKP